MKQVLIRLGCIAAVSGALFAPVDARQSVRSKEAAHNGSPSVPRDYVIGPEDVLSIAFWQETAMSAEVVVRPDGKISLPLLKDVHAAGYTPEELTAVLVKVATRYIAQPNATVIVKQIHSRRVYVVGQVEKPGAFQLTDGMTVVQLIAMAEGILEYANAKNVIVVRQEGRVERRFKCNYKDVLKGKNVEQNIRLKPGDTVIVP